MSYNKYDGVGSIVHSLTSLHLFSRLAAAGLDWLSFPFHFNGTATSLPPNQSACFKRVVSLAANVFPISRRLYGNELFG